MVPWQRSHSHLLNDDKRRNKQNLSKKINADSQRFSFYKKKQALAPSISAFLNGNRSPTRTFLQVRKAQFTGTAWSIHSPPICWPVCDWLAMPQPEGWSPGTEWDMQIHARPGPSALDQLHAPTPPSDAATATHFRVITHISTFLQNDTLDHKIFRTDHVFLP